MGSGQVLSVFVIKTRHLSVDKLSAMYCVSTCDKITLIKTYEKSLFTSFRVF